MTAAQQLAEKLKEEFYASDYGSKDIAFRNHLTGQISKIESATTNPYIHEKTKGLRRIVNELFSKNHTRTKADQLFQRGKDFAYAIESATRWTGDNTTMKIRLLRNNSLETRKVENEALHGPATITLIKGAICELTKPPAQSSDNPKKYALVFSPFTRGCLDLVEGVDFEFI